MVDLPRREPLPESVIVLLFSRPYASDGLGP